MHLQLIDWLIVLATLLICFVPALFFGKRAGKNTLEFFVSGRAAPWWLAGVSMVATTFSSDRPNRVTRVGAQVRRGGQLAMVGIRAHGRVHGVLLCPPVRVLRGDDGPGVLRIAL
ncbi:MAG: hypothetical protein ACLQU3_19975 [Limisphaerales bacterium]